MLYAKRDEKGNITSLQTKATDEVKERVSTDDPEVLEFLNEHSKSTDLKQILTESDIKLARVVEDLIDLLVDKNIIMLTELPEAAQLKLVSRRRVRNAIHGEDQLMVGEDDIL
ncbi:MAG: hypothetical protein OEW89_04945 [Gammaproteobacteria bacterium]|nr:hypothetical protein [Gammaproteobacteria bacterium]MDH5592875.1 hypothetical protein [Gammaproteobacteria bacterium]